MILSSADITLRLSKDPVVRALASVRIVDARPPLEAGSGVAIYISKYPQIIEFEATWNVWIIDFDNEPLDILIAQLTKILPRFQIRGEGARIEATVTELYSGKTETRRNPPGPSPERIAVDLDKRFEDLRESIEDRMLLAGPGRPGKDGRPGRDGLPGRDGRDGPAGADMLATGAELGDLRDVFVQDARKGHFLMFDGSSWISRFVPQILKGSRGGIEEAPEDGRYYTRVVVNGQGQWIDLLTAIQSLSLNAGDFDGQ